MKYLLVLSLFLLSCAPPVVTCPSGELLGTDSQCYSCNYGTPEFASGEFGYCSTLSAGGVACCSTVFYNYANIKCYPNEPWLCSDALCHTTDTGVCVYVP